MNPKADNQKLRDKLDSSSEPSIVVIGNLREDMFVELDQEPNMGQTIELNEKETMRSIGGKAVNQAIACAKLGNRKVKILGFLSDDESGNAIRDAL